MGVCGLSRCLGRLLALPSLELFPQWCGAEFLLDFAERDLCCSGFLVPQCLVSIYLSKPGTSRGWVQRGRGAESPARPGGPAEQGGCSGRPQTRGSARPSPSEESQSTGHSFRGSSGAQVGAATEELGQQCAGEGGGSTRPLTPSPTNQSCQGQNLALPSTS